MEQGDNTEESRKQISTEPSQVRPRRGGGRGRGRNHFHRGRGRHGRGARGRDGRGHKEESIDNKESKGGEGTEKTEKPNSAVSESHESHDGEAMPSGGRTSRRSGRGRGRGGSRGGGRTKKDGRGTDDGKKDSKVPRGEKRGGRGRRGRGHPGRGRGRSATPPSDEPSAHPEELNRPSVETGMEESSEPQYANTPVVDEVEVAHDVADSVNPTVPKSEDSISAPATLALPKLPAVVPSRRAGVPIILSRHSHPPTTGNETGNVESSALDYDTEAKALSEQLAASALEGDEEKKDEKPNRKSNKGRKKSKGTNTNNSDVPQESNQTNATPELSTTDALKALPAQEVSITSTTLVQISRSEESSNSLSRMESSTPSTSKSKPSKSGKSKHHKNGLSKDNAANQRAAKKFNNDVRACVEASDPNAMREILHDKRNHSFALDKVVLEVVMKAYVMAAMFEDALYCLRHCAMPGTLTTVHTERILTCLPQNLRNSSAFTAADMINALCIATEFDNPTSRTYFLRIVRGISLEFLEEATSARDRICSAPCERLVRSGLCVVDARLKRGKKPTELLVQPGNQLGVFVPDTMENRGIQAGDAVSILPYAGPYPMSAESLDRNMIEATVINTNPMVLRLQDKTNANLHAMLTEKVEGNVYRIDKLANRMGFNRQLAAAVAIASPLDDSKTRDTRRPCPELIRAITAMDENIDRAMKQSGHFPRGELTSTAALCSEVVPWSVQDESDEMSSEQIRDASLLALNKYGALEGLNSSQRLAVEGATSNRLTLVQGPPGTGKTAVAIRILQHWARLAKSSSSNNDYHSPILATSDSNIAVDNLVEGCASVGLSVVRLGRPEAIRPELLRFCIDRPPSSYANNNSNANNSNQQFGSNSVLAHKERMKTLKNAQVICCTCIGSGGDILDAMTFERVLVDEATQATEPAVLVPLMRGCRQLVLVGDHCQLPPTVLSTRAEEEGHGVPLFSRMVACGVPPFMLDTQYRMHPCIAMFPSDLFYGGKLLNGVSAPERRPLAGFPWPREEFPVAFMPVKGIEMDDGVSKYNEDEAAAACDAVAALLQAGQCSVSDIAVVTPYAAQARLIRRMTRRLTQTTGPPFIEVSSVDGFQGREKEAVVFSAVRSNDYGAIGFTSDWRRVNVSFTRARRALIVIGNDVTLRRGDPDTWMPWLAWADAHGINMEKPGVPRGRYDPEQLRRVRGGTTAAEMLRDVLERQQAQLKTAEKQHQKAEKSTRGHIIGSVGDDEGETQNGSNDGKALTLEEDLARLENTDGNWDDSEDEDNNELRHSNSRLTLASAASSFEKAGLDETPQDAWDL